MKFVADFHIHSKYSRACSPRSDVEHLSESAEIKGINVLGTGDFTHPKWLKELKHSLRPSEDGLFRLKNGQNKTRFILTSEISCIYPKNNKTYKIHILVLAPSFEIVDKINIQLASIGNLESDGRPILRLDAEKLAKIVLSVSKECLIIPAHIWTPWFGMFGSRSGFDSIEECFGKYSQYIYAVETGLSSDPPMNWRLSSLDNITLVSNSDAHSPENIGREANVFDTELSYLSIINAIKNKDPKKFLYTIEFFPEQGKYYYDGHRSCGISCSPSQTKQYGGVCPVCGKKLTFGVLNRVEEISDRDAGFILKKAIPFKSLIPLKEIISQAISLGKGTKGVQREYQKLIGAFNSELNILLNVRKEDIQKISLPKIAQGIIMAREGDVFIEPGFDGVYGNVKLFPRKEDKKKQSSRQKILFSRKI